MKNRGSFIALGSGVFWGLDTAITSAILTYFLISNNFYTGLILAFCHDFVSAILFFCTMYHQRELSNLKKIIRKKSALIVSLGAILGGPMGMFSYFLALKYIGVGYSASISATYPVVAAFLGYLLLKDKLSIKGWVGLLIIVCSVVFLGFSHSNQISNFYLGFTFALICTISWGSESVLCAYGMKDDISPLIALFIRQCSCVFLYIILFFILPTNLLTTLMSIKNWGWILVFSIGVLGSFSYLWYYRSISLIGPVKATGLNITYAIWATFFSVLFGMEQFSFVVVLTSIFIIFGSYTVIKN